MFKILTRSSQTSQSHLRRWRRVRQEFHDQRSILDQLSKHLRVFQSPVDSLEKAVRQLHVEHQRQIRREVFVDRLQGANGETTLVSGVDQKDVRRHQLIAG